MKEPGITFNIKEEGLIGVVPFSSNRIIIIGTAERGPIAVSNGIRQMKADDLTPFSSYEGIEKKFGTYDQLTGQSELTLMRGVDLLTKAGANYIYPIRICDGNESGGTFRIRKSPTYRADDGTLPVSMELGSYDTGSYSKDIQFRIKDNDNSPLYSEERFFTDGTNTGFTLKYYPSITTDTAATKSWLAGGAFLTGSTHTTVEWAETVDIDGNQVEENGVPDWDNLTTLTVHYVNWLDAQGQEVAPSLNGGEGVKRRECIIHPDTGSPWGANLKFHSESTAITGDGACRKGYAIRVRYFYDVKDLELKWNNQYETYTCNHQGNWVGVVNSGSTMVKLYSDTGTEQTSFVLDSGTTTMPMNLGWTNLNEGNDGRAVGYNDYKAALELVSENNWDKIVFPGNADRRIHNYVKTRMNNDEDINKEHVAFLGHDTGQTLAEIRGHAKELRDKLIRFYSFGENGIGMINRYTDKYETGSAAYGACLIAANVTKRSISYDLLAGTIDGMESLEGEWNKATRELLLDDGIACIKKDAGYRISRDITSSTSSAWLKRTTVAIVHYARRGLRSVAKNFIGKKNISRNRSAMESAMNNFLKSMVRDEHLESFTPVTVSATRAEQISGEVKISTTIRTVFHIEYPIVDMSLE